MSCPIKVLFTLGTVLLFTLEPVAQFCWDIAQDYHEIAILCNPLWDCNCNAWMQMYKVCRRQKNGAYVYRKQLLYDLSQTWEPQNSCHYKFTSSGDKHFSWLSFIHSEYLCTMEWSSPCLLGWVRHQASPSWWVTHPTHLASYPT